MTDETETGVGAADESDGRHRGAAVGPSPLELPAALRGASSRVSGRALVALLALALVVLAVFALRVLAAGDDAGEPVTTGPTGVTRGGPSLSAGSPEGETPEAAASPGSALAGSPGAAGGSGGAGPSAAGGTAAGAGGAVVGAGGGAAGPGSGQVVVHVVGRVTRPGLVRLPAGSRVADAVEAAGGAAAGADLALLNLARLLVDGEQLRVPRPGEVVTAVPGAPGSPAGGTPGTAGSAGSAGSGAAGRVGGAGSSAPVSLNSADVAALDALPGIGPVLAQRIVDWRTEHGRFTSVAELGEVSGIGEKLLAQITPKVTL